MKNAFINTKLILFLFSVISFYPKFLMADTTNMEVSENIQRMPAAAVKEKAKKKLYPGGADEEPLKVQAQLLNPNSGVAPEIEEAPATTGVDSATD